MSDASRPFAMTINPPDSLAFVVVDTETSRSPEQLARFRSPSLSVVSSMPTQDSLDFLGKDLSSQTLSYDDPVVNGFDMEDGNLFIEVCYASHFLVRFY